MFVQNSGCILERRKVYYSSFHLLSNKTIKPSEFKLTKLNVRQANVKTFIIPLTIIKLL